MINCRDVSELRDKYRDTLARLDSLPETERHKTRQRFLLLKEFTDIVEKEEKKKTHKKYRRTFTLNKFCREKGIAVGTFYRWKKAEGKRGIEGLISSRGIWGWENENIAFLSTRKENPTRKIKTFAVEITLNPLRPLSFLRQIKELIESRPEINPQTQKGCSALLSFVLPFVTSKFTPLHKISLTEKEIIKLNAYRSSNHKNHSAKAKVLLMAHHKRSFFEIVAATDRSPKTVYRWIRQFKSKGIEFIETKPIREQKETILKARTQRVVEILHSPPSTYNLNRSSWTYDTIIKAYEQIHGERLERRTIQKIIKNTKYTWRHARKVLTSNDPDYKEKIAKVLETLRSTKKDEAFFFIDELGPYKVKAYGGKSLTAKGVIKTAPKKTKGKGEVQCIAALEAFTNQLTWEFSSNKNSKTIVGILEKLKQQYTGKTKLFVTWDGISSHRSSHVSAWVKDHNAKVRESGSTPYIKIVPLPSKAQFLNVIESVFGGMNKAVIQNSDYASKDEMEAAIERHFTERNIFYQKNPKRVGNKIWDEQAFKTEELPGGLFKKM